jgi:hypothetical protein
MLLEHFILARYIILFEVVNVISNSVLTDILGYVTGNDVDIQSGDLLSLTDIEKAFTDNVT